MHICNQKTIAWIYRSGWWSYKRDEVHASLVIEIKICEEWDFNPRHSALKISVVGKSQLSRKVEYGD